MTARYTYGALSASERGDLPTSLGMRELRARTLLAGLRKGRVALGADIETIGDLLAAPELRGWSVPHVLIALADLIGAGVARLEVVNGQGHVVIDAPPAHEQSREALA